MVKLGNLIMGSLVPKMKMLFVAIGFFIIGIYFIPNFSSSIRRLNEEHLRYTHNEYDNIILHYTKYV